MLLLTAVLFFAGVAGCDGCGSDGDESSEASAEADESAESEEEEGGDEDGDEAPAESEGADKAGAHKEAAKDKAATPPEKKEARSGPAADPTGKKGRAASGETPKGAAAPEARGALSPEEKRRTEREERIAQLKRRNEERRKDRLARHAGRADEERKTVNDRGASPTQKKPVLDVSRFLSVQDVRTLTGERTLTTMGHLKGIPTDESYNSAYFAPSTRSNFGVALQVWKERIRRDANQRYTQMRADFPNAEDTTALGGKSFISHFDDIVTLTFADLTKRVIVSVSCGQRICTGDQLLSLANAVKEKL